MAIFCTIYYILSYIETIPQIIKLIKTKSSNDYSLGMIMLQLISLISWSLYIFTSLQNIVVYIGTIIDLLLLLFVDYLILKYYKFNKKSNLIIKEKCMKNKLILFDWGNIVESHTTGYTCHNAFDDLFYECGYRGNKTIFNHLGKYQLSCIRSVEEFENVYQLIAKEFNFNKSFQEFVKIYKKIFDKIDYYKEVADYEISLKNKCCIGILSNLTIFDKERLNKQVNLSQYDYVFLSFEMGLKKPNIEIYNQVQKQLPFAPKDILFIDDRKDNIETALKIGWNTLQATGLELDKIKKKCEYFLK